MQLIKLMRVGCKLGWGFTRAKFVIFVVYFIIIIPNYYIRKALMLAFLTYRLVKYTHISNSQTFCWHIHLKVSYPPPTPQTLSKKYMYVCIYDHLKCWRENCTILLALTWLAPIIIVYVHVLEMERFIG